MANLNSQLNKFRIPSEESPSNEFIVLVDSVSVGKSNMSGPAACWRGRELGYAQSRKHASLRMVRRDWKTT